MNVWLVIRNAFKAGTLMAAARRSHTDAHSGHTTMH